MDFGALFGIKGNVDFFTTDSGVKCFHYNYPEASYKSIDFGSGLITQWADAMVQRGYVYDQSYPNGDMDAFWMWYVKGDNLIRIDWSFAGGGISVLGNMTNAISVNNTPQPTQTPIVGLGGYSFSLTSVGYKFPWHLYSFDDKTYLGKLVTNSLDRDSIYNDLGKYGSNLRTDSIWNSLGKYGSSLSNESAFNDMARKPPKIADDNGNFVCYLTENSFMTPGVTFIELDRFLRDNRQ